MLHPDAASYERAFRRAGLPTFVAERTARDEVWARSFGLLSLVFVLEVLGAVDLDVSLAANVGLLAAALGLVLVANAGLNAVRRRPLLAGPQGVGTPELVAFVAVPALLPLVLNQQPVSALVTALANLALLAVLYLVIAFGLVAVVVWAGRRLLAQLSTAATLVARAVPLLLLFSVVLFINTEMWQVFALLSNGRLALLVLLLTALAGVFVVVRLPDVVTTLGGDVAPLDRSERVNVGLVLLVSQGLQVAVVAIATGSFFVALGLLAIPPGLIETWTGQPPGRLLGTSVTPELLRVSVAIGGFSAFYYAIAVLTDATYREEFASELSEQMRTTFTARAEYRELLRGS